MLICHMLADTIGELLEMADKIEIARRHFQPWSHPHFDLSQTYRSKAILANPIPVERRELVKIMRVQKLRLKKDLAERLAYEATTEQSTRGLRARALALSSGLY